jgi:hypothetical protein
LVRHRPAKDKSKLTVDMKPENALLESHICIQNSALIVNPNVGKLIEHFGEKTVQMFSIRKY